MSPSDTLFFAEMYSLVKKMEETIDEFDMKDRTLASIVVGVLDLDAIEAGEQAANAKLQAAIDTLQPTVDYHEYSRGGSA